MPDPHGRVRDRMMRSQDRFSGFHVRLQSARGLAALMVAAGHTTIIIERLQVYDWTTLNQGNAFAFLVQLIFQAARRSRSSSFSADLCSVASRAWRATIGSANSGPSPASVWTSCYRC